MKDAHSAALEKIIGDMDDMEGGKMFGEPEGNAKGVDITISVVPKTGEEDHSEPDGDEGMNKGGMVPGYAKGGVVEAPHPTEEDMQDEEMKLPPWLRKKKKS